MEDLNILRDKAYQNAVAHGWHDKEYSNEHWLCLVISELMEAVQADRNKRKANRVFYEQQIKKAYVTNKDIYYLYGILISNSLEDELADVCIRILDLAGLRDINLSGINFPIACGQEHLENRRKMTFTEWSYDVIQVIARFDKNHYPIGYLIVGILQEICCKAKMMGFDILWHVEEKMKYNELRPYMHGNKAY